MKKLGLLIIMVSFIGATSSFAQPQTKAKPTPAEQAKGTEEDAPCNCGKSGKPSKVSREQSGTLATGQDQKAEEATGSTGGSKGEQNIQKGKK